MANADQYVTAGSDVAVIGMAGFFPGSPDLNAYWRNIVKGAVTITEIPAHRWDIGQYFDPGKRENDGIVSKWGAFLPDIPFDPMRYGIPPKALNFIETSQLLLLESTRLALNDAGYLDRTFDRDRTSVFIGTGAGQGDLGQQYSFRSQLPRFFGPSARSILSGLGPAVPEWREDAFTGIITNIAAGRIADRFNFRGVNCTIDAACASALAALRAGIQELFAGESDMVVVGGADTLMSPYAYTCFSKVGALSSTGRSRPFDREADGIVLGEGVGTVILKRLADAERDGDPIYAVIKTVGASSDGRGKGLTVPKPEGQITALSRAYDKAGIAPETITLIEAHGTATKAGDNAEAAALHAFFTGSERPPRSCGVGSVKSMIGHTKCAAGIASLIKTVLALYHRVLPPTAGVESPVPHLAGQNNPLYLNTRTRPWFAATGHPRRAGVSAFGFGGTNFHAILEEYTGPVVPSKKSSPFPDWETELFVFQGETPETIVAGIRALESRLAEHPEASLKDLAYTQAVSLSTDAVIPLAIVASSINDLKKKLETVLTLKAGKDTRDLNLPGVYFSHRPMLEEGKIAFVYPGQGSQYTGMLNDLALAFPLVREVLERFDRHLADIFPAGLSRFINPPPSFTDTGEEADESALVRTNVTQAAMGAVDVAMHELLTYLGVVPDMTAGHSYGEYPALFAAGVLTEPELARISEARGRFITEAAEDSPGVMAAVKAPKEEVTLLLERLTGVWIANINAPDQTVISGSRDGVNAAMEKIGRNGITAKRIPVACAFHSPLVDGARSKLGAYLAGIPFQVPQLPVWSNATAARFPENISEIKALLAEQLVSPVRFAEEIMAMHDAGARVFVEVGAGAVLTGLISATLQKKAHLAVATDRKGRGGIAALQHTLAALTVAGVRPRLDRLFTGRRCRRLDRPEAIDAGRPQQTGAGYIIGGGTVRRAGRPSPEKIVPRAVRFADEQPQAGTADRCIKQEPHEKNTIYQEEWNRQNMRSTTEQQGQPISTNGDGHPAVPDDAIMARFQDLMSQFLETQKTVMTAWLNGPSASAGNPPVREFDIPDIPAAVEAVMPGNDQPAENDSLCVHPPESEASPAVDPASPAPGDNNPGKNSSRPDLDLKAVMLQIVSDCTGYPVEMLELEQEIDADLGIDSIKRMQAMTELESALGMHGITLPENRMEELVVSQTLAELLAGLESMVKTAQKPCTGAVPPSTPETPAGQTTNPSPFDITAALIAVVSDLTGYPADMLELDQEIDAELGIDSIKRMEILTHFEDKLETLHIQLTDNDREHLGESVTLNDIVDRLETIVDNRLKAGENSPGRTEAAEKAVVQPSSPEIDTTAAAPAHPPVRDPINASLYTVVEQYTGYPAEILEPDLSLRDDLNLDEALLDTVIEKWIDDLEADRTGVRAATAGTFPEKAIRLGDLTDWMEQVWQSLPDEGFLSEREEPDQAVSIRRYTLYARKRELIAGPEVMPAGATVLVTMMPGDPLARAVAMEMKSFKCKTVFLEHDLPGADMTREKFDGSVYCADFTDFDRLAAVVDDIRETYGAITALLHLAPLAAGGSFAYPDLAAWKNETGIMVKSLFYLAKLLSADLNAANRDGSAGIVAATVMGGTFASADENTTPAEPSFSPITGGICGFLKCLAEEMPGLNIRIVDNDPRDTPETIAAQIGRELLTPSADIEVGYQDGCRLVLDIVDEPLGINNQPLMTIEKGTRLLVTGGARGITAAVALELARRFQPTLLLVGRTSLSEKEGPETTGITDEKQLKALLAKSMKSQKGKVRPADLEKACHNLLARREIRETLTRLRAAGSEVHYLEGDVTDAAGFSRLIASVYEKYGGIDGVIHGAGQIEDKPVKDKDIDAFDRVFDTKADSLFILSRSLQADSLRFLALFSSVAGRYGNAGQADYGAANEVYNKTALYLNRVWPGRVVSFIWGPWESRGMVSPELRRKFNAAGIFLIPRDTGVNHFINELLYGPATATEVIYGGWDDRKKTLTADSRMAALPLFSSNANFYPSRDGNVELIRRLDTDHDYYLRDHKLDGYPVLPMAMAMEMMAEAVAYRYPDYHLSAFNDFHVLRGIVLRNGFETINIVVNPIMKSDNRTTLDIQIRDIRDKRRVFYRSTVELLREKPVPGRHISLDISDPEPFALSVSEFYEKHLFHGPLWHGIRQVETIGKNGIIGRLKSSRPRAYLPGIAASDDYDWLIDPLIIDSGLQLVALWMRCRMNAMPLPTRLKKFVRFNASGNGGDQRCEVRVRVPDKGVKSADLFFLTPDGSLSGLMEGLEIIGGESLNRLAAK